ncbi:MAG: hypothetical protein JSW09_05025 [Pseudomonadota bacterium]|nr:MAG: hypothetical protein JSW09_05025 [Pseudomonadota bacterium]
MKSLETAVAVLTKSAAAKKNQLPAARSALSNLIGDCEAAIKIWQGYLAAPTTSTDNWSIVAWIGAERGKRLHETNLLAKAHLAAIAQAAGGVAARTIDLEDELIEMAYRMLKPGETGVDAANSAVRALQDRITYLRGLIDQLDKPAVGRVTAKATKKKTTGKKSSKTKSARKPTRATKTKKKTKK